MFKIYNNQKAFGIIEVLVAAGLMSIIGVGISSLITNAAKQQKGIQAKDQQREVTSEIRTLLSDRAACLNTFGTSNITSVSVPNIKDAANAVVYSAPGVDKTGMLNFTEFGLSNFTIDASAPATSGNIDFKIKLTKVGDVGNVKEIKPDLIVLKIKRNAGGTITECFAIGKQADGVWQISPTNSNDIHYPAGNVGIGTTAPVNPLDVVGKISVSPVGQAVDNAYNGNIVITKPAASGQYINLIRSGIYPWSIGTVYNSSNFAIGAGVANDSTFTNPAFVINTVGNVGLGTPTPTAKLEVAGEIRTTNADGVRINFGGRGIIQRNDGSNFYLLVTAAGDPNGTWNGLRPLYFNLATGAVTAGTSITSPTHYGTSFLYTSDARLKKNIIDFNEGLNFVKKMRPVRYQWKSNSKHDIGFIAQDIEKIAPELTDADDKGIKRIDYAKMVPILVKAIQEQQIQIDQLKKQLNQK